MSEIHITTRLNITTEDAEFGPNRYSAILPNWIELYVSNIFFSKRRVTIDEIAVKFNMSHGSAYSFVLDDLGYRKVCSRWVRRQQSDDHKRARQTICQEYLDCHTREGDAFFPSKCDRRHVLGVQL